VVPRPGGNRDGPALRLPDAFPRRDFPLGQQPIQHHLAVDPPGAGTGGFSRHFSIMALFHQAAGLSQGRDEDDIVEHGHGANHSQNKKNNLLTDAFE
jgi:hypothetical protein